MFEMKGSESNYSEPCIRQHVTPIAALPSKAPTRPWILERQQDCARSKHKRWIVRWSRLALRARRREDCTVSSSPFLRARALCLNNIAPRTLLEEVDPSNVDKLSIADVRLTSTISCRWEEWTSLRWQNFRTTETLP